MDLIYASCGCQVLFACRIGEGIMKHVGMWLSYALNYLTRDSRNQTYQIDRKFTALRKFFGKGFPPSTIIE